MKRKRKFWRRPSWKQSQDHPGVEVLRYDICISSPNGIPEPSTNRAPVLAGTEGQELLDYHPCAVAAGAGGIFGRIAGQSGQMAPAAWRVQTFFNLFFGCLSHVRSLASAKTAQENMLYSDWNDCMQGDINRDLVAAKARPKLLAFVSLPTSLKNPLVEGPLGPWGSTFFLWKWYTLSEKLAWIAMVFIEESKWEDTTLCSIFSHCTSGLMAASSLPG